MAAKLMMLGVRMGAAMTPATSTITETLPPANTSFQDWQSAQLQGIQSALAQATGK